MKDDKLRYVIVRLVGRKNNPKETLYQVTSYGYYPANDTLEAEAKTNKQFNNKVLTLWDGANLTKPAADEDVDVSIEKGVEYTMQAKTCIPNSRETQNGQNKENYCLLFSTMPRRWSRTTKSGL